MAQPTMHAQMGGEITRSEELIQAGAVPLGLGYRLLPGRDEGLCIHFYGNASLARTRNCPASTASRYTPTTTTATPPSRKMNGLELDYTAEGDPLAWALDKSKPRLPAMLMRCEAEPSARDLDQRDIDAALPKIAAWAEATMRRKG